MSIAFKLRRSIARQLPRLGPFRRTIYRAFPRSAEAAASELYTAGNVNAAKAELELTGRESPLGRRIAEIYDVLENGLTLPPRPAGLRSPSPEPGARPIVVHALHNSLPFDQSGYAHRSHSVLTGLAASGFDVHPYTRLNYPIDLKRGEVRADCQPMMIDDICYRRLLEERESQFDTELNYVSAYAQALAQVAGRHHAHIIHAHSKYTNGIAAVWAANWTARKSVYEVRGLWHLTRLVTQPDFADSPLYAFHECMELEAMRQADAVVTLSESLRDWIAQRGIPKQKIHVAPTATTGDFESSGPDPSLAERLGLEGRFVVGYAGSLTHYEGLDTLLKSVQLCAQEDKDIAAVIVGKGRMLPELEQMVRELGIADRVRFVGHVSGERVAQYYSLFDVCPLPRLDKPVCRLVPPLKPLEIMSAGKPLVVSALPPLLEFGVEGESRLSVSPGDAQQLASVLMRLKRNPDLCRRIGEAGRDWIKAHRTWMQVAGVYSNLYRQLCEEPVRANATR